MINDLNSETVTLRDKEADSLFSSHSILLSLVFFPCQIPSNLFHSDQRLIVDWEDFQSNQSLISREKPFSNLNSKRLTFKKKSNAKSN